MTKQLSEEEIPASRKKLISYAYKIFFLRIQKKSPSFYDDNGLLP